MDCLPPSSSSKVIDDTLEAIESAKQLAGTLHKRLKGCAVDRALFKLAASLTRGSGGDTSAASKRLLMGLIEVSRKMTRRRIFPDNLHHHALACAT